MMNAFDEAMLYEENAEYDRFDGRDEYDYCGEQADNAPCPDCGEDGDCDDCLSAKADYDEFMASLKTDAFDDPDDCPF